MIIVLCLGGFFLLLVISYGRRVSKIVAKLYAYEVTACYFDNCESKLEKKKRIIRFYVKEAIKTLMASNNWYIFLQKSYELLLCVPR